MNPNSRQQMDSNGKISTWPSSSRPTAVAPPKIRVLSLARAFSFCSSIQGHFIHIDFLLPVLHFLLPGWFVYSQVPLASHRRLSRRRPLPSPIDPSPLVEVEALHPVPDLFIAPICTYYWSVDTSPSQCSLYRSVLRLLLSAAAQLCPHITHRLLLYLYSYLMEWNYHHTWWK